MNEWILGKATAYDSTYNPDLLIPIARHQTRSNIGISDVLPFKGIDIWNAWELSWLNVQGKPIVACARFQYSAETPFLIESKSFKLYLNSFNQSQFISIAAVTKILENDLKAIVGGDVSVTLYLANMDWPGLAKPKGVCIDDLDIEITDYQLSPNYLVDSVDFREPIITEQLYSHLFKSNCMITGQPDWATIFIDYTGRLIDHAALLKYLISFRNHQAFHEPCVERIFVDLMQYCQPDTLSVYCRYTRRGGLDINPFRTTTDSTPDNDRIWRQ